MRDVVLVICLGLGGFVLGLSLFCCVLILVLDNVMGYSVRVGDIGVFLGMFFCTCLVSLLVGGMWLGIVFCVLYGDGFLCVSLGLLGCFLVMFSCSLFVSFDFDFGKI